MKKTKRLSAREKRIAWFAFRKGVMCYRLKGKFSNTMKKYVFYLCAKSANKGGKK